MYKTKRRSMFPNARNDRLVASILAINTRFKDNPIYGDQAMVYLSMYRVNEEISEQEAKPYFVTYGESVRMMLSLDQRVGHYYAIRMRPIKKIGDHGIIKSPDNFIQKMDEIKDNPVASSLAIWERNREENLIMSRLDPGYQAKLSSYNVLTNLPKEEPEPVKPTHESDNTGKGIKSIFKSLFMLRELMNTL